jgi:hypothetical protein
MYEKKWMTIAELSRQGIPKRVLYEICHTPGQRIAVQFERRGVWRIDTTKLDDELKRRAI